MAVYLTCTRTRGQQKKHIDICHRCDAKTLCRPYQDYVRDHPNAVKNETPVAENKPPAGSAALKDVLEELTEIKLLLSGSGKAEELDQEKIVSKSPPAEISIGYLIREIENIKSLYPK